MSALYEIVMNKQWQVAITHIQSRADGDAADQLFYQNQQHGMTTIIMRACVYLAPLELVQLIITKAKLDSGKRCLPVIADQWSGSTALYCATYNHIDPAVLELLIREHPLVLCATNSSGRTPLQLAAFFNPPAAITSLLTSVTNAFAAGDYAALAALVHGSAFALRCQRGQR